MARNESHLGQFSLVLQKFAETLSEEQRDDFGFSTLEDFQAAILDIQKRQSSERKMRNLTRLSCFIEAMEQYGKVIEVFVNVSEIVAFIWGPAKFLLQVASTYTEAFDSLLDAYQSIGENIPLLSQYQALFQRNPHMQVVLKLIYNDILKFHMKALKYFHKRTWRQLFHATWKTFQSEFSGLIANIHRHGRLVESQANLVEFEHLLNKMEMGRVAMETEFQKRREDDEVRRRIAVRNWLSAANVDTDQEKGTNIQRQYSGSGRWLIENIKIHNWLDFETFSSPLLWLNGIPGAGKTVLASLLVDKIQKLSFGQPVTLTFFYFKHKDSQKSSFNSVARAILTQILHQNSDLLNYVFEKSSASGEIVLKSLGLAKELLETALKSCEKVYIVLDGLDECDSDEKKMIISWFRSLIDDLPETELGSIRCLFISQNDGEIGKLLSNVPAIQINPEDTEADIKVYTATWAKKIQEKFDLLDNKKEEISATVASRANGMFLFAKLVMENLFSQTRRENLTKELEPNKFPRGLEDAYARIVDRILRDPATKDDAKQLLGWLVCSKRPLKWREIQGAVSINLETKNVDIEERQLRVGSKVLCGSLVEQRSDGSIELVHLTARFFLIDQKYVNLGCEEFELTRLCLGYLNFRCFQRIRTELETKEFVLKGCYSFLEYAVLHWVDHLEDCILENNSVESITSLETIIEEFLHSFWSTAENRSATPKELGKKFSQFEKYKFYSQLTKAASIWKNLRNAYGTENDSLESLELVEQIMKVRTAIEKISTSSNSRVTRESNIIAYYGPDLFKCSRISCKSFTFGFSTKETRDQHLEKHKRLFSCTYPGCPYGLVGFNSVRDLNRHLANSHEIRQFEEIQFSVTQSPKDIDIKKAVCTGSVQEVERWLEQFNEKSAMPANKVLQDIIDITINKGDELIFGLLMKDTPNMSTSDIRYLLNHALLMSRDSMTLTLLDHPHADPFSVSSGFIESPVATVIRTGKVDIFKSFIDRNDINWNRSVCAKCPGSSNRTDMIALLSLAAREGHLQIVEVILRNTGVDVEFKDAMNHTALFLAAENTHIEIVKLLAEKGANVDSTDSVLWTPLFHAAKDSSIEIVKLLIEKGADINFKDSFQWTPLFHAAKDSNIEIVKLLIEMGADINSKDSAWWTPLFYAAKDSSIEIVKLLIEKGADIDSTDSVQWTPLFYAAKDSSIEIVKLLVEKGADINSKDLVQWTPLFHAAKDGSIEIVKLLVEKGADINSEDSFQRTPLFYAAENGHIGVKKWLVAMGANITFADMNEVGSQISESHNI